MSISTSSICWHNSPVWLPSVQCPRLRSSFTCFIVYTAACFSSVIHEMCLNFLPQILTKTGSPLSVLLSDLNCVLQHVCELWVIEVRMWVARVLTVNTGVIARCHPALDRDARMQRGEAGIHWALQYEISHTEIWDMRYVGVRMLCSLQIFLKWCAAEQHWDKVCNFGKYFELWKDKTILQYYLYHSYNCTMSSNNTSAVKSTSHHL